MNRLARLVIFGALVCSGGSYAVAQCMDPNQASEAAVGHLVQRQFRDAAGRPEDAYILTLPSPICLSSEEETDNVEGATTLHLVAENETLDAKLRSLVGQVVMVRGKPFGAITVHHHAPIVFGVVEAETQRMTKPEPGSALRAEVLDAVRPVFEGETGGLVEFVVRRLNVIGDWVYGEVQWKRPGGRAIDWRKTPYAEDFAAGMFDPAASNFLLRRSGATWAVTEYSLGPTDVVWVSWRLDHQLPLALFQW